MKVRFTRQELATGLSWLFFGFVLGVISGTYFPTWITALLMVVLVSPLLWLVNKDIDLIEEQEGE